MIIFFNHNANLDFDKIPHGRDRPTAISDMLKNQDYCSIFFKKGPFLGPKKNEIVIHEIERMGMVNIKV